MVTEEEIEHVAKLMHIDIDNHVEYIEKVQKIMEYFDVLDSAGVESEEITVKEIPISKLRADEYVKYDGNLIDILKKYKENFIRSPKLI